MGDVTKQLINALRTSFLASFFSVFGFFWLIIESTSKFISTFEGYVTKNGLWIFITLILLSVTIAVILNLPKKKLIRHLETSNTFISIRIGNLLDEKGNIALGVSNYFDTEKRGTSNSLKRQVIDKLFGGDSNDLNAKIQGSLSKQGLTGNFDSRKTYGNRTKHEIGTVATVIERERKIFFVVLAEIFFDSNNNKKTITDIHKFNKALYSLWNKVDIDGNQEEISIPVLGSGLSRLSFPPLILIQTIILSYIHVAAGKRIAKQLNIIVNNKNYDSKMFEELDLFLKSIKL